MALNTKGKYKYADSQADIRTELLDYSTKNGYAATQYKDAVCTCGGTRFRLYLDDAAGVGVRYCTNCGQEHFIGDSKDYLEDAEPGPCECPCGNDHFEITAGIALYTDSEDVKWLYIGCRCVQCSLTACYGDWKNEYIGYKEFLERI